MKTWKYFLWLLMTGIMLSSCEKNGEIVEEPTKTLPNPIAAFDMELVDEKDPFTFRFVNKGTNYKEVRWNFGDDSTSVSDSPVHTYRTTGTYIAKLIVLNENGDWAQREEYIRIKADDLIQFIATPSGDRLDLSYTTPYELTKVQWYKDDNGFRMESENEVHNIAIARGSFATYRLRGYTPKGSTFYVEKMLTDLGIVRDLTNFDNVFSVSKDNNSGADGGEGSKKLIDNNLGSKFLYEFAGAPHWWQLEYYAPQVINAYSFTSANDADTRDPRDWDVLGSNDGTNWTLLDSRVEEMFPSRRLSRTFIMENTEAYRFYRVLVKANRGSSLFQLAEFRALELPR